MSDLETGLIERYEARIEELEEALSQQVDLVTETQEQALVEFRQQGAEIERLRGVLQRLASPTRMFQPKGQDEWTWDEEHRARLAFANRTPALTPEGTQEPPEFVPMPFLKKYTERIQEPTPEGTPRVDPPQPQGRHDG